MLEPHCKASTAAASRTMSSNIMPCADTLVLSLSFLRVAGMEVRLRTLSKAF